MSPVPPVKVFGLRRLKMLVQSSRPKHDEGHTEREVSSISPIGVKMVVSQSIAGYEELLISIAIVSQKFHKPDHSSHPVTASLDRRRPARKGKRLRKDATFHFDCLSEWSQSFPCCRCPSCVNFQVKKLYIQVEAINRLNKTKRR